MGCVQGPTGDSKAAPFSLEGKIDLGHPRVWAQRALGWGRKAGTDGASCAKFSWLAPCYNTLPEEGAEEC